MNLTMQTTKETQIFSTMASLWWDEAGPFKALHAMNPVRMAFMLQHMRAYFPGGAALNILDVGCGGGLVCEPFARLGYDVTGIDQSMEAIQAAQIHAAEQSLSIHYACQNLQDVTRTYDVITMLEVLEHAEQPEELLILAVQRLKPGGLLFFSTLNRTAFSYVAGILLAERVLGWAPKGTHQWGRFLKPSEIIVPLQQLGMAPMDIAGIEYSVVGRNWLRGQNLSGNYIGVAKLQGSNGG